MQPDPRIVSILHRITDLLDEAQNGLRYLDEDGYEWVNTGDLRNELKRLGEAEEHPDLWDADGIRWTWVDDVYLCRCYPTCAVTRPSREALKRAHGPLATEAPRGAA